MDYLQRNWKVADVTTANPSICANELRWFSRDIWMCQLWLNWMWETHTRELNFLSSLHQTNWRYIPEINAIAFEMSHCSRLSWEREKLSTMECESLMQLGLLPSLAVICCSVNDKAHACDVSHDSFREVNMPLILKMAHSPQLGPGIGCYFDMLWPEVVWIFLFAKSLRLYWMVKMVDFAFGNRTGRKLKDRRVPNRNLVTWKIFHTKILLRRRKNARPNYCFGLRIL